MAASKKTSSSALGLMTVCGFGRDRSTGCSAGGAEGSDKVRPLGLALRPGLCWAEDDDEARTPIAAVRRMILPSPLIGQKLPMATDPRQRRVGDSESARVLKFHDSMQNVVLQHFAA
jgi:hypothetical protein